MQYTQSPIGLMTVQLDHLNFAACIIDFVSLHLLQIHYVVIHYKGFV